jgi:hypothetical protein
MPLKFRVNKDCSSITDDKLLRQVPEPDRSAGEHVHQVKGGTFIRNGDLGFDIAMCKHPLALTTFSRVNVGGPIQPCE